MKTVTGGVLAAKPISLSKAATLLSSFVSSENGASQAVSAYLRRASTAFNELKSLHRDLKSSIVKETHLNYNISGELDALDRSGGDVSRINDEGSHKKMEKISEFSDLKDNGVVNKKTTKKSKKNIEEDEIEKENGKKKRKGDKEMRSEEKKRKKKSKSKEISSS